MNQIKIKGKHKKKEDTKHIKNADVREINRLVVQNPKSALARRYKDSC